MQLINSLIQNNPFKEFYNSCFLYSDYVFFFHFFQKFFDPLLKKWTPFTLSLPFWIACHAMHSELYNRIILKDRDKLKRSMSHIKFHVNRKRQNNNESIIVR